MLLTERQLEILQCLFDFDHDFDAVAQKLVITRGSAVQHMKNIYRKLLVNNAAGAFRVGLAKGWISLEASIKTNPPLIMHE